MGAFTSRNSAGVEEIDYSTVNAYRYPPKSGCYFGSYFIMGGERFDTTQPEAYLFGENNDLNFLGNRPVPFPYPAPQANEPTKTLKSLVNIRKDSIRFIKIIDDTVPAKSSTDEETEGNSDDQDQPKYNIEFTFDTDVRVAITVYYFATEEISNGQAIYHPRDSSMNSETYHYKRGANQTFSQSTHIIEPLKFAEDEWLYNADKEMMPVVIQCVVEDEVEHIGHSHITFCTVEKLIDGTFTLKPLKQKQMVDGLCYLLQEIYGIENKNPDRSKVVEEDLDADIGNECVICMCDIRDTLILPCRHLCLCNGCADSLRYQANNCPICRAPFRALLQIRAMRKKSSNMPNVQLTESEDNGLNQENVPPGYEAVALIEALNGPNSSTNTVPMSTNSGGSVPTGISLPTSPEESPVLDKRKNKQNSSTRGRWLDGGAIEEGEEAREVTTSDDLGPGGDGATAAEEPERVMTPEIKMLNEVAEVNKSNETTPARKSSNKKKKKEAPVPIVADSESDVDKTPTTLPHSRSNGSNKSVSGAQESPSREVDVEAGLGTGEEDAREEEEEHPGAAYTAVSMEAESDSTEREPCLPAVVIAASDHASADASNQSDTPSSGSDGSSYGSTGSHRNLLTNQTPGSTRSIKTDSEAEKGEAVA